MSIAKKRPVFTMLSIVMIGMIIMLSNNSIINMLIPTIVRDLKINLSTAQWLSTGFILVCGVLVPLSAYLVRRFTYKQLFHCSLVIFIVGSFICGLSTSFSFLFIGRIIQSIGTGISMPLALNIITDVFPISKRGTVMGIYGLGLILAPAVAPSLGGLFISFLDWHILFLIMGIFEVLVLIGSFVFFKYRNEVIKLKFDTLGFIYSTLGFGFLLYGISTENIIILVLSALILAIFVKHCLNQKDNALLNVNCFKDFNFSYALIINIIFTMAMYSGMLLMPMYLQNIRGFSPMNAALLLLPGSLVMGLLGVFTGRIYDRYGIKYLAIIGSLIMCSVTFMFSHLSMNTSQHHIMFIYLVRSIGVASVISPIASAGLVTINRDMFPDANALTNTIKQISGSVGSSLSVVVMSIASSHSTINNINLRSLHGINIAFLFMTFLALISVILAIFYKKRIK
ncbi:MAG: DHA2 family efflux MFS transporter permease subunit [Bacilli bacterium]|jgi:EmrB/QacA subfamily drug resistance transporter|nr:DHA2 family efflux MFS transporter permease subunit [Bacilli bacterium]